MKHTDMCQEPLVEIYRHSGAASDAVVRWCSQCGAVVVDEDYDGRTRAGSYQKMRFPSLLGELMATKLVTGEMSVDSLDEKDKKKLLAHVERVRKAMEKHAKGDPKDGERGGTGGDHESPPGAG